VILMVLSAAVAFAGGDKEPTGTTATAAAVKNPDTFIYAAIGDADSLDPAKAYDNASWTNMAVIYETLVTYDGTSTSVFKPVLTTQIPTVQNGGITNGGKTYRFPIRKNVKFHGGQTLTPDDVEYSFERNMVVDPDGGPGWIWFQVFFGGSGTRDGEGNIVMSYADIDKAVEVDGDAVVFNLAAAFPPFVSVLAGRWGSIVNKAFVAANGGWDGTEATWKAANNPETDKETLNSIANGTGPYKLVRWDKGVEIVVERFDGYWGPKPALARGIYRIVEEFSTRKLMLLQGDADLTWVPALNYPEMDTEKGITIYKDLPSLSVGAIQFNQKINAQDNPFIYSGKLDGQGIPANFFTDKDVRLGFAYAWDEATFIRDIMNNTSRNPVTPVPFGLPYKDESLQALPFDKAKATEHLRKAWGGQLWANGFKVDFFFNTGNSVREASMKMLAENLKSLNPKFQITVRGGEWAEYVDATRQARIPIFFIGWAPDYPDPDNYLNPYMFSSGFFARPAGYKNEEADRLIQSAAIELDTTKRQQAYYRLQQIWLDDLPAIMNSQSLTRWYFKDWAKGYYYNPMHSDPYDLLPVFKK
jgi:peptide/nickel transport system substrate-binding protein